MRSIRNKLCWILLWGASRCCLGDTCNALVFAEPYGNCAGISIIELRSGLNEDVNGALEVGEGPAVWISLRQPFVGLEMYAGISTVNAIFYSHRGKIGAAKEGKLKTPQGVLEWLLKPRSPGKPVFEIAPIHALVPDSILVSNTVQLLGLPLGMCLRERGGVPTFDKRRWRVLGKTLFRFAAQCQQKQIGENAREIRNMSVETLFKRALAMQGIECEVAFLSNVNALSISMKANKIEDLKRELGYICKYNSRM